MYTQDSPALFLDAGHFPGLFTFDSKNLLLRTFNSSQIEHVGRFEYHVMHGASQLVRYSNPICHPSRVHSKVDFEATRGAVPQLLVRSLDVAASILLVEDENELRALLRTVLRCNGYSVTEACDCHTALDLLQRQNFDVVLLDITLPDGNGFRVAEAIRENHLTSKVIVITGIGGLENALRSAALGVQDYISKPFKPQYLLRSIEHALSVEHSG